MITAGLNDYPTRLAVLDQQVADHHDVMMDIVKTYSNAVLSSDLVSQLEQQISGRTTSDVVQLKAHMHASTYTHARTQTHTFHVYAIPLDIVMDHKLSLGIELDPVTQYLVKVSITMSYISGS